MTRPVLLGSLAILALAALPLLGGNYLLRLATTGALYVALASSWNIVGGFSGYPSFATAAFFGLGAYAAAILRVRLGLPLPLAWGAGALAALTFAVLVGPAILRLRGHYFAVGSLVLAGVLRECVNSATGLTGGGMGLTLPGLGALAVDVQARLYFLVMAGAAGFTVLAAWLVLRGRLGWALRCIEQNEDAAIVLGVNTLAAKVAALAISAASAGLVGAIYATWIGYIDPVDVFDDLTSVKPIIMAFLGGVGTVAGPAVGAVIFLVLEELVWRNALSFHKGLLGGIIVVLLVFVPGGFRPVELATAWLRNRVRRQAPASERPGAQPEVPPELPRASLR